MLLVVMAGVLLRLFVLPQVLFPGGVLIHDPDSCYHLRRALMTVQHYPSVPRSDPYLGFPEGAECPWPPLYDFALASAAMAFGGDQHALESVALALPPLVGAIQMLLVFLLGREVWGRRAGLLAALLMAVLPVVVSTTTPGMVDHHGPMIALETLAVLAAVRWAKRGRWSDALIMGAAVAGGVLTFLAVLLFVPVLEVWVLLRTRARRAATQAALAHLLAASIVAVATLGEEGFGLVRLSWAHSLLLLWPGLLYLARSRFGGGAAPWVVLLIVGWAGVSAPGAGDALSWGLRHETFMDLVAESRPMFSSSGASRLLATAGMFSPLVFVLPAIAAWAIVRRDAAGGRLIAVWGALYWMLSLQQRRFGTSLAPALCLLGGWAAQSIISSQRQRRRLHVLAVVVTAGVWVTPLHQHVPNFLSLTVWLGTGSRSLFPMQLQLVQAVTALRWLKDHSPPSSVDPYRPGTPAYGVLSGWGFGHLVLYHAERPAPCTNFGTYVAPDVCRRATELLVRGGTEEAVSTADSLKVRYVMVTKRTLESLAGHARLAETTLPDFPEQSLTWRLLARDGSGQPMGLAPRARLVWETGPPDQPWVKIFEIVPGARVEGRTGPLQEVRVSLRLRFSGGRAFVWWQATTSDDDGAFELLLPYATGGRSNGVGIEGPYHIEAGDRRSDLPLSEEQVREGATITLML